MTTLDSSADTAGGTVTSAATGRGRGERKPRAVDNSPVLGTSLVLLAPLVLLELGLLVIPLGYIAYRSLFDWQPGAASPFIGFENYASLFADPTFWQVVYNQAFLLIGLPLWIVAPVIVAFMLRERVRGAAIWRSIYFFPAVMSPAIVGLVFRSLLSNNGPVNSFLSNIGLGALSAPWLTDAHLVKPVIIVLVLWTGFGTGVLILSAALGGVPQDIFEAARMDGAGFWRELWYIAIPSIRSAVVLWAMFQVVSIFLFMFGWIYVLTGGGPGLASTTMDFSIYQRFMRFGFFGTAAAQSVVLVAMIIVVPLLGWVIARVTRWALGAARPGAPDEVGTA